jgi:hypothetical protein
VRALVEIYLHKIASGEIGTAENAVDMFLAHRFRLEVIDQMGTSPSEAHRETENFYLKHPDDKGDHIFVNDNHDIVGILDWEWCSTVSKEEAFSSPCMMWPVAKFYDGSNVLADEEILLAKEFTEKGRGDLANYVLNGQKTQRFLFSLGPGGALEDKRTFAQLFMGLKRAFDMCGNIALGQEEVEWEAWKARAIKKWKSETLFQALLAKILEG